MCHICLSLQNSGDNRSDSSRTVTLNHVQPDVKPVQCEKESPQEPPEQRSRSPICQVQLSQQNHQVELLHQLKLHQQQQVAKRFKDPRDFLPDRSPKHMASSADADRAAREWALTEKALEVTVSGFFLGHCDSLMILLSPFPWLF